jgi:hypothetical protein
MLSLANSLQNIGLKMGEIVITKRARASRSKNALEDFSKLRTYAYKASLLVQRKAKKNGIAFTIIKNEKIYKVFPDGKEVEQILNRLNVKSSFEPIVIAY